MEERLAGVPFQAVKIEADQTNKGADKGVDLTTPLETAWEAGGKATASRCPPCQGAEAIALSHSKIAETKKAAWEKRKFDTVGKKAKADAKCA